jgi:hypothetical protein
MRPAGLVLELRDVALVSLLLWWEEADWVLRAAMLRLVERPVNLLNGWSVLVLQPADERCLFLLAASPMCTPSSMSDEWSRLWFWSFLYNGALLCQLCHWLVTRVGSCGLLKVVWGGKGRFCSTVYRETEGCDITGSRCTSWHVGVPHTWQANNIPKDVTLTAGKNKMFWQIYMTSS